jgi:prephenate dehydratase
VGEALAALHRVCDDVRFLGSYPRADDRENRPAPETSRDAAFADADAWLARVRAGESC